jgi:hypothetical protein
MVSRERVIIIACVWLLTMLALERFALGTRERQDIATTQMACRQWISYIINNLRLCSLSFFAKTPSVFSRVEKNSGYPATPRNVGISTHGSGAAIGIRGPSAAAGRLVASHRFRKNRE